MKVFISWSGERSKTLARSLREWLPLVLQSIDIWMSDTDIRAGERWATQIGERLETSGYGILCLTRENLSAPWVLFEAGALARSLSEGAVCPLLLDSDFSDIAGSPLNQFQAKKLGRDGIFELVGAINQLTERPLEPTALMQIFEAMWPRLERHIATLPSADHPLPPPRRDSEVLEELVTVVRALDKRISELSPSRRSNQPRPSGHEISLKSVAVAVDELMDDTQRTNRQLLLPAVGSLLETLSKALALNPSTYGDEWFVFDERDARLSAEELNSPWAYANRGPLRASYLPF